jgi:hypothetical protein
MRMSAMSPMATVLVARAEAALVPLRVAVAEPGAVVLWPVRVAFGAVGIAGTTPVARAGGTVPGAAVSPVRTVPMVTVERPFGLPAMATRRNSVDEGEYLSGVQDVQIRRSRSSSATIARAVIKLTRAPAASPS